MQKNGSKTRMLAYTALVAAVYAGVDSRGCALKLRYDSDSFFRNIGAVGFCGQTVCTWLDSGLFHCKLLQSTGHGGCSLRYLLYRSSALWHHPFQQKLVYRKPLAGILQCVSGRGILSAAKRTTVLDSRHHCAG